MFVLLICLHRKLKIILRLNKKEIYHSYPLICYSEVDSESDIGSVSRKAQCSDYDFWHFANAIR